MTRTAKKVVLSAAVGAVALSAAGMGTYAAWSTSKTTDSKSVTSGTFGLTLTDAEIAVTDLAPADTVERTLTLKNSGSIAYSGIAADVTTVTNSALLDGTDKSLQWSLRSCSMPFAAVASGPVADDPSTPNVNEARPAYAVGDCTGTAGPSVTSTNFPAFSTAVEGTDFGALAKDATTYVRVNAVFPTTTGNEGDVTAAGSDYATYGNKSAAFAIKFTATQRAGVAK